MSAVIKDESDPFPVHSLPNDHDHSAHWTSDMDALNITKNDAKSVQICLSITACQALRDSLIANVHQCKWVAVICEYNEKEKRIEGFQIVTQEKERDLMDYLKEVEANKFRQH